MELDLGNFFYYSLMYEFFYAAALQHVNMYYAENRL